MEGLRLDPVRGDTADPDVGVLSDQDIEEAVRAGEARRQAVRSGPASAFPGKSNDMATIPEAGQHQRSADAKQRQR